MSTQMYFIAMKGEFSQDSSRELQRAVRHAGGFILMVTRNGLLVALGPDQVGAVTKHPLVQFMGPVMLNPRGIAAKQIEQIFAENLSKQLIVESRGG